MTTVDKTLGQAITVTVTVTVTIIGKSNGQKQEVSRLILILFFYYFYRGSKFLPNRVTQEKGGMKFIFRALHSRNYRLFFGGQAISLVGTWMQRIAMGWLVYRITGSAFLLGAVEFVGNLPAFLVIPFVGVLADRWNRHKMVIFVQAGLMIQAFILASLVLLGNIQVWQIFVLSVMHGIFHSLDTPVRQAFVMDMLERREDIGNAIALNSSLFNLARLVGPSIAGILIGLVGEGMCFLLNGVSYFAVLIALFLMKIHHRANHVEASNMFGEIKKGFTYTFGFAPIRSILMLLSFVSLIGIPYMVLMPVMAKDVLKGGPEAMGFLMASIGVGALIGSYYLAWRKSIRGLERVIPVAVFIFGCGLIAFSASRFMPLSMFILVFCGFGLMVQMASSNTVLQIISDQDKRGRVMSYYTLSFRGVFPFGGLIAGMIAGKIGAPAAIFIFGICCIAGAFFFTKKLPSLEKTIHQLYEKRLA